MSALCHKRSFFKHLVGGMEDETNAVDRQMSSPFEHLDSKNRWQVTGDLLPTLTFVEAREDRACPYRKSNPHVLMMQPTKDGPRFDTPGELNDPSNRCILA